MALADEDDVRAALGRDLTEEEKLKLPNLLIQAKGLIEGYTGTVFAEEVPDVVRVVAAQVVANALTSAGGAMSNVESLQHSAGPYARTVRHTEGSTSGSPWLTRQLKMMLGAYRRSMVSVPMVSDRSIVEDGP